MVHQEARRDLEDAKKESLLDKIRRLRKENLEGLGPNKHKMRAVKRKDLSTINEEHKLEVRR